jgi:hypothetical protein
LYLKLPGIKCRSAKTKLIYAMADKSK